MWLPRERQLQETITVCCHLFWTVHYKKQNVRRNLSNKMNADDSRLLGCDIISLCEQFPTFQRNIEPSSTQRSVVQEVLGSWAAWTLMMKAPLFLKMLEPVTQWHSNMCHKTQTLEHSMKHVQTLVFYCI